VGDDSHYLFRHTLLGDYGSVRRGIVMVKQPVLFSPKVGATSSHVFTQSNPEFTVWPVWTGASRYHNCCMDGGTSPDYFGFHLVLDNVLYFDCFKLRRAL
jgi:hypothetical protein